MMSSRFLIHIMPRFFLATELQEFVKLVDVSIDQERLVAHHQTNSRFPDPKLAIECIADLSSNVEVRVSKKPVF